MDAPRQPKITPARYKNATRKLPSHPIWDISRGTPGGKIRGENAPFRISLVTQQRCRQRVLLCPHKSCLVHIPYILYKDGFYHNAGSWQQFRLFKYTVGVLVFHLTNDELHDAIEDDMFVAAMKKHVGDKSPRLVPPSGVVN